MSLAQQKSLFGEPLPAPSFRSSPAPALTPVQQAAQEEKRKPGSYHFMGKVYQDPRPDIDDDSELWVTLPVEADKLEPKLWGALLGFRCIGARLLPVEGTEAYALRPYIDPSGDCGFRSQEEYRDEAERWLRPHEAQLKFLLANVQKLRNAMWGSNLGK